MYLEGAEPTEDESEWLDVLLGEEDEFERAVNEVWDADAFPPPVVLRAYGPREMFLWDHLTAKQNERLEEAARTPQPGGEWVYDPSFVNETGFPDEYSDESVRSLMVQLTAQGERFSLNQAAPRGGVHKYRTPLWPDSKVFEILRTTRRSVINDRRVSADYRQALVSPGIMSAVSLADGLAEAARSVFTQVAKELTPGLHHQALTRLALTVRQFHEQAAMCLACPLLRGGYRNIDLAMLRLCASPLVADRPGLVIGIVPPESMSVVRDEHGRLVVTRVGWHDGSTFTRTPVG